MLDRTFCGAQANCNQGGNGNSDCFEDFRCIAWSQQSPRTDIADRSLAGADTISCQASALIIPDWVLDQQILVIDRTPVPDRSIR